MQAQQKLFIIFWSAAVVVCIGLMGILYASLIPHFAEIGDWAVWVARLIMVCISALAATGTWFKIVSMYHESKYVKRDDVVTYHGRNKPYVVSADNFAAKIPRMLPAPPGEKPVTTMEDETIIELYREGNTLMQVVDIAKAMGAGENVKYNRVQAVIADAKKRGVIAY